jgi:hypothetical protein
MTHRYSENRHWTIRYLHNNIIFEVKHKYKKYIYFVEEVEWTI